MKTKLLVAMGLLLAGLVGRATDTAALKAELIKTEGEFFEFALVHGFGEAVHEFIAPDGFVANSLTLGRAAQGERVKAESAKALKRDRDVIRWQPLHAEVAASGELGYTWGVAESAPAKEGPFKPYGIYVTIWKRQADGTWRFVYDAATILTAEKIEAFVHEHFPHAAMAMTAPEVAGR